MGGVSFPSHGRDTMTCYYPVKAWRLRGQKTKDGKSTIIFNLKESGGHCPEEISLPCGQCMGCRLDRSRQWAVRCVHEGQLFENNCFITLTYSDENLPPYGSLNKSDFQKFMKRLRKQESGAEVVVTDDGKKTHPIRYFHCGEYGAKLQRPHHHACIFNFEFGDKTLWETRDGVRLYRSESLEKLWPFGFATIGDLTIESAAYVARYIMKKINGDLATVHYTKIDEETGEMYELSPEYITMSRRPGLGKRWFDRFKTDVYGKDFITVNGKKFKTPRYYDKIYDVEAPGEMEAIKQKRVDNMKKHADNNTSARLRVREKCQKARNKNLIRSYER